MVDFVIAQRFDPDRQDEYKVLIDASKQIARFEIVVTVDVSGNASERAIGANSAFPAMQQAINQVKQTYRQVMLERGIDVGE